MKNFKVIMSIVCALAMLVYVVNPLAVSAQKKKKEDAEVLVFSDDALKALDQSIYIEMETKTVHLDTDKALENYEFTKEELAAVQTKLDNLSDEQVQDMINYSMSSKDKGAGQKVAPVIIWGGIAVLGIFTGAALYFSSKYMTYKEKQNLINRCYDMGGTPSIDSGDTGGLSGAPKKAWWKISSTYSFECVK